LGLVLCGGGRWIVLREQQRLSLCGRSGVQGTRSKATLLELQLRAVQRGVLRRQELAVAEPRVGRLESDLGVGILDLVLVHRGGLPSTDWRDLQAKLPRCVLGHPQNVRQGCAGRAKVWSWLGDECDQWWSRVWRRRQRQVRLPCAQQGAFLQAFLQHSRCETIGRGLDRG